MREKGEGWGNLKEWWMMQEERKQEDTKEEGLGLAVELENDSQSQVSPQDFDGGIQVA